MKRRIYWISYCLPVLSMIQILTIRDKYIKVVLSTTDILNDIISGVNSILDMYYN